MLVYQTGTLLHQRLGVAVNNFLPVAQSELTQSMVKGLYILDFITLADDTLERNFESGRTEHLKKFLFKLEKAAPSSDVNTTWKPADRSITRACFLTIPFALLDILPSLKGLSLPTLFISS